MHIQCCFPGFAVCLPNHCAYSIENFRACFMFVYCVFWSVDCWCAGRCCCCCFSFIIILRFLSHYKYYFDCNKLVVRYVCRWIWYIATYYFTYKNNIIYHDRMENSFWNTTAVRHTKLIIMHLTQTTYACVRELSKLLYKSQFISCCFSMSIFALIDFDIQNKLK